MRILISGASGMIGSALQSALRVRGHTPVPLSRNPAPGSLAVRWDPAGGELDPADLRGIEAVVHLAGEGIADSRWTDEQKARILDSRTKGTSLLAEAVAAMDDPPAAFVSGSAIGYYGDRGDELLDETSPPGDDFLADVCVRWEACAQLAAAAGIRTCTVRTGIVLDARQGALAKQLLPFKLGVGGRLGSGEQWQSWITLEDEVRAICHLLLDSALSGPVNLTAPNPVRNREFTSTLGRVLRRPTLLPIPTFAPSLLYGRELVEALLLVSQRVEPSALEADGFEHRHRDLEPALRAVLDR